MTGSEEVEKKNEPGVKENEQNDNDQVGFFVNYL